MKIQITIILALFVSTFCQADHHTKPMPPVIIDDPITDVDKDNGSDSTPAVDYSVPANIHDYFNGLLITNRAVIESIEQLHELGAIDENEKNHLVHKLTYRIGLITRYLEIHKLFENATPLQFPPPNNPTQPGPKPLTREDIFIIANAYLQLLQEEVPEFIGGIIYTDIQWRTADNRRLYFATEHENAVLVKALAFMGINDQRRRIRNRLLALSDATIGATHFLPGGSITENIYVASTGKSIKGDAVGALGRLLSIAEIGLEMSEVVIPILRVKLRTSISGTTGSKLSAGTRKQLLKYLDDANSLKRRLDADGHTHTTREIIQEDWVKHLDALMDRKSTRIATNEGGFTKTGEPTADQGIDNYSFPKQNKSGSYGIVRELKVSSKEFNGNWSRSFAQIKQRNIITPEVKKIVSDIGGVTPKADSLSWAWIIDRAILGHRKAKARISVATTQRARQQAIREAAAAQDLLQRFSRNELRRQHHVMQRNGEVIIATGRDLENIVNEVVPKDALLELVKRYLSTQE